MHLTKEDLAAIGSLIDEKNAALKKEIMAEVRDTLAPIREALKELLKIQVQIVQDIVVLKQDVSDLKLDAKFIKSHILLQEESFRGRMQVYKDLD